VDPFAVSAFTVAYYYIYMTIIDDDDVAKDIEVPRIFCYVSSVLPLIQILGTVGSISGDLEMDSTVPSTHAGLLTSQTVADKLT
jgi:hypothetical protein